MSNIRRARTLMKLLSLAVALVILAELGLLKSDHKGHRARHDILGLTSQLPSDAYWTLNSTWILVRHTTRKSESSSSLPKSPTSKSFPKYINSSDMIYKQAKVDVVKGALDSLDNKVNMSNMNMSINDLSYSKRLKAVHGFEKSLHQILNSSVIKDSLDISKTRIRTVEHGETIVNTPRIVVISNRTKHSNSNVLKQQNNSTFNETQQTYPQQTNLKHAHKDKQNSYALQKKQQFKNADKQKQQLPTMQSPKALQQNKTSQDLKPQDQQKSQDQQQQLQKNQQRHEQQLQQNQRQQQKHNLQQPQQNTQLDKDQTQVLGSNGTVNGLLRESNKSHSTKKSAAERSQRVLHATTHKISDCIPGSTSTGTFSARKRFLQWQAGEEVDKVVKLIGPDLVLDPGKYFIYRCDSGVMDGCCGWADRVRGILGGYLMANLTGRVFKIEMLDQGCDLTNFYVPNKVNWSLPRSFHHAINISSKEIQIIDVVNDHAFSDRLSNLDLANVVKSDIKYVYFKGNLNFLVHFRNSKIYKRQLFWMHRVGWHRIHAVLFRRLFKVAPKFKSKLDAFLSPVNAPQTSKPLVCAHIRVGDSIAFFKNFNNRMEFPSLDNVWRFIANKTKEFSTLSLAQNRIQQSQGEHTWKDTAVFVTSDSSKVLNIAKNQTFGSSVLAVPGDILHVDKNHAFSSEAKCRGLEKLLMEQAVLMNCDVLMISHSGVSTQAASLRNSHQQLYIFTENYDVKPYRLYC